MAGRRVLVTGGAGFIGSHLVEELLAHGHAVTIVDRRAPDAPGAAVVETIAAGTPEFRRLLERGDFDAVFHLAGPGDVQGSVADPRADLHDTIVSGFELLDAARSGATRAALIFASTASVYGTPVRLPIGEDDPTVPLSPYGVSKLAIERYAAVFSRLYGIRTVSLRFFSLYGPRQRKLVVYDLMQKFDGPGVPQILGDGSQVRDFCFVGDAVRAARMVWERAPLQGEVYNVGAGTGVSIRDLAERIRDRVAPASAFAFTGSTRPGDGQVWIADVSRVRALGFEPACTIDAGLDATVAWYRASRAAPR